MLMCVCAYAHTDVFKFFIVLFGILVYFYLFLLLISSLHSGSSPAESFPFLLLILRF